MSNEQNLDDILKLLNDVVSTNPAESSSQPYFPEEKEFTQEEIEKRLKEQYLGDSPADEVSSYEAVNEYVISEEFLSEAKEVEEEVEPEIDKAVEEVIEEEIEEAIEEEIEEEVIEDFEEALVKELEEDLANDDQYEDIVFNDDELEQTSIIELEEAIAQEEALPVEEKPQHHETFLASMRKTGIGFTADDLLREDDQKSDVEKMDNASMTEEIADTEELDISTINIMMQFCEKDELEDIIGDSKVEEFLVSEQTNDVDHYISDEALNGKEYVSESQNEAICDTYKRNTSSALLTAIGCGIVSLLSIIYDLLPIMGIQLSGLMDYVNYPVVYSLIGLQFVVFVAAICYKKIWSGLKRAFSMSPNTHSVVGIILSLTVVYDIIVVIVLACTGDGLPLLYNGIACFIAAVVMLSDYFDIYSESLVFNVYSSSSSKYTLTRESEKTPIGAKLYGGGLENIKSVYSAESVEFPRGFFRGFNVSENKYPVLTVSLVPVMVIGMILAVISVILGTNAYASCGAFMMALYVVIPITLIFSDSMQNMVATLRLTSGGSAYAGKNAIEKYSDCNVLVFKDSHLFKQIKTDSVGFALYDTSVGYLMLGCLDTLFKYIGGPLSGIKFDSVPEAFKFNGLEIRRMARNGIDAVIENKHSLLVGDHEFMKRYGLSFPANETDNRRSTLCVSLNGRVTAKLSIKYDTEPIFEMLAERLYAEGVSVAVTTADPLISSKAVEMSRTIGASPISVIHKSVDDFVETKKSKYREDADGIISCQSRLKLAAVVVWLKRMKKLKRINLLLSIVFSIVGIAALVLLVINEAVDRVNHMYILSYLLVEIAAAIGITAAMIPTKKYFTVEGLYAELEMEHLKKQKKANKKSDKQEK